MKILVDMNLTPDWARVLEEHGWPSLHWSTVSDPRATDHEIMEWAAAHGYVLLTHDLDFGAILAETKASGPSVIQIRARDVLPDHLAPILVGSLKAHETVIEAGALVVVDESRSRVRILPLSDIPL